MDHEAVEMLRIILLLTIRDRGDRVRVVHADGAYSLFYRVNGLEYEMVPAPPELARQFPAVLAWWEPPAARLWHMMTSGVRLLVSGSQRGSFRFPVGTGAVAVEYRVRWRSRRVEEIEITIRGAESVVITSVFDPNRWDVDFPEG